MATCLYKHGIQSAIAVSCTEPGPTRAQRHLFAVWDRQVPTWEAAAAVNALSTTSVIRWLVSTLPPTTAAFDEGLSMLPAGILILIGVRQPCRHSRISADCS